MKEAVGRRIGCVLAICLVTAVPAAGQGTDTQAAVTLQATGTFARGGTFTGTITINRFEQDGSRIVAVGFLRGVLTRGGRTVGTVMAGEVSWPVVVRSGGASTVSGPLAAAPQFRRTALAPAPAARIRPVQAAACPVLDVTLAPADVDVLGVQLTTDPVVLNLQGEAGTPLGNLVCAASDLIGNVAGLVQLLSNILGLLTGVLGGLTGGLGGALPGVVASVGY
jgi:hypothetical protein